LFTELISSSGVGGGGDISSNMLFLY